ncbi:MAG: hypothetical protein VXZ72_00620 [Chlamydiota bacterium]|nr:hypothetical protein [Chlamydiota bacterium]
MIYYVFSGSLKGTKVDAAFPAEAVVKAVMESTEEEGTLLGPAIRVSVAARGAHPLDVYFAPPYEDQFPELFEGELEVTKIPVEKL